MASIRLNRTVAESKALADYNIALGSVITVESFTGYIGDDSIDVLKPMTCRVIETPESDLLHWNDEWLDPYWNVEPVGELPEEAKGMRSMWVFGPSYQVVTACCNAAIAQPAPPQAQEGR